MKKEEVNMRLKIELLKTFLEENDIDYTIEYFEEGGWDLLIPDTDILDYTTH